MQSFHELRLLLFCVMFYSMDVFLRKVDNRQTDKQRRLHILLGGRNDDDDDDDDSGETLSYLENVVAVYVKLRSSEA